MSFRKLFIPVLIAFSVFCSCRESTVDRITLLPDIIDGGAVIEPYNNQWLELYDTTITVLPHTWYELSADASSSLPALQSSVYLGARFKWGDVLKDREFLLFHDNMTPLKTTIYTYNQTEITVFCGAWINQTVSFQVGNVVLKRIVEKNYKATTRYCETYRPEYHFTPRLGWINDPNGMFYKDGKYHLCYQYNPHSPNNYTMHWGHSVSKDLIHWKTLPIAIYPDSLGSIFSGSAVVDENNTANFGKGAIVAMYTSDGHIQQQCLAYSTNGRTFQKYNGGQPVLSIEGHPDFRDPKVSWCEKTGEWVAVMTGGQEVLFYGSSNLKEWHYLSSFGMGYGSHAGTWECPDLIRVPVESTDKSKYVLIVNIDRNAPFGGSATQYFVGDFDGTVFIPDEPSTTKWMDYGKDHYACVTWGKLPNDRVLAIAWMSNWQYARNTPTTDFRGEMTIPRDLSLYRNGDEYYLRSAPSREMAAIRHRKEARSIVSDDCTFTVSPIVPKNKGVFEVVAEIESCKSGRDSLILGNNLDENVTMILDYDSRLLSFDRRFSGQVDFHPDFKAITSCPLPEGVVNLHLFVDRGSMELFINNGEFCMTNLIYPNEPYNQLQYKISSSNPHHVTVKTFK